VCGELRLERLGKKRQHDDGLANSRVADCCLAGIFGIFEWPMRTTANCCDYPTRRLICAAAINEMQNPCGI
jgi:hypothetical protein